MTERAIRKGRISKSVRHAIEQMVDHSLSRAEAANAAGITDNWLYSQLRRPEVQALRHERMRVLRESEASRTISRVAKLADTATSEHVKLDASKWLGEIEGIQPVARSENVHHHIGGPIPGLTIVFNAPALIENSAPLVIEDASIARARAEVVRSLPAPVPHPAMRVINAEPDQSVGRVVGRDSEP